MPPRRTASVPGRGFPHALGEVVEIAGQRLEIVAGDDFDRVRGGLHRGEELLVGLELAGPASDLAAFLFDRGILAGGSDDRRILRLMPPLVLEESDLDILEEALGEYTP